jgi:hypothetical protein
LEDIPADVQKKMTFHFVSDMMDALHLTLEPVKTKTASKKEAKPESTKKSAKKTAKSANGKVAARPVKGESRKDQTAFTKKH